MVLVFYHKSPHLIFSFSLIDYDGSYSYGRAYLVGLLNTILVSVIGIVFATLLGVIVGVSRLSNNFLVSKFAETYVEIFRNIPLLLQIFFWYFAALRALPLPQEAINLFDVTYLTVKGWFVPRFLWTNLSILTSSIILAIVAIIFVNIFAKKTGSYRQKNSCLFNFIRIDNNFTFINFLIWRS